MSQLLAAIVLVYRGALHLYPPGFRQEFGTEMALDFREAMVEAWQGHGWRGLAGFWVHAGMDLSGTLAVQWLRSSWGALALIPAAVLLLVVPAAAELLQFPEGPPVAEPDRDLLMLLVMIIGVLLVIMFTIVLTIVFTRKMRYRPRGV